MSNIRDIDTLSNAVKSYNSTSYITRPVKFTEYISDKYNIVHKQLYTEALSKLINMLVNETTMTLKEFKRKHRFVEIKGNEFWEPSTVIVISKVRPFKKEIYSLNPYWNWSQSKSEKRYQNIKVTDTDLPDSELIYLNYLTGQATLESRQEDVQYDVDFDFLDGNIERGEDYDISKTLSLGKQ